MVNRAFQYRDILIQIRERQRRLDFLRKMIGRLELAGQPVDNARMNLLNLLREIKSLQNKIRKIQPQYRS